MEELRVRIAADGTVLSVPASLDAVTTYVLLEQEGWFEKEVEFVRRYMRPGMTAIDIGANLGVYSIPMARRVGPTGAVYSFEPATTTRAHLSRSAELNDCANLHVIAAAVSDRTGEAQLALMASSELNKLLDEGTGERVKLTSLDAEEATAGWRSPDFIKIDAEGEEVRILAGGHVFFSRRSPLIMFEIKGGTETDQSLRHLFQPLGYNSYRLLGGEPILVPDNPAEPIDAYELNLFAAKPDRAAKLAAAGLLVERIPRWQPDDAARSRAITAIARQAFGAAVMASVADAGSVDPTYLDCLAAYATWRTPEVDLAERCAAVEYASANLFRLCKLSPSVPRFSSLARAAWDAGRRQTSVNALGGLLGLYMRGERGLQEPFWPASPRFDAVDPGEDMTHWFRCSIGEQLERARSFTSCFAPSLMDLEQLCANPFVSAEMERRRVLEVARAGKAVSVPRRLCTPAADHVNAELWRAGLVPNTRIEAS